MNVSGCFAKGDAPLNREEAIARLRDHAEELRGMGVASLSLYGSLARDQGRADSDMDLLVRFSKPVGLFQFFRVQHRIEDILNVKRVDLVEHGAVHPALRERVFREAIRVA